MIPSISFVFPGFRDKTTDRPVSLNFSEGTGGFPCFINLLSLKDSMTEPVNKYQKPGETDTPQKKKYIKIYVCPVLYLKIRIFVGGEL